MFSRYTGQYTRRRLFLHRVAILYLRCILSGVKASRPVPNVISHCWYGQALVGFRGSVYHPT